MTRLHKPRAGFWIRFCVAVLYPLDSLLFKIRWHHLDRIPPKNGVIIAVNHISHVDTIAIARLVWQSGRIPRFLIKHSVFEVPVIGRIMHGAKQIPVFRGSSDAAQSLKAAKDALDRGEAIIIYPEGTITKDPDRWPMQGKTGIARLAVLTPDVPIIPVGQWGAHNRPGFPRPLLQASVGEPVDLGSLRDDERNYRKITDKIMSAIRDEVAKLRGEPAPIEFFKPKS